MKLSDNAEAALSQASVALCHASEELHAAGIYGPLVDDLDLLIERFAQRFTPGATSGAKQDTEV
jgi:hypothetical protein